MIPGAESAISRFFIKPGVPFRISPNLDRANIDRLEQAGKITSHDMEGDAIDIIDFEVEGTHLYGELEVVEVSTGLSGDVIGPLCEVFPPYIINVIVDGVTSKDIRETGVCFSFTYKGEDYQSNLVPSILDRSFLQSISWLAVQKNKRGDMVPLPGRDIPEIDFVMDIVPKITRKK